MHHPLHLLYLITNLGDLNLLLPLALVVAGMMWRLESPATARLFAFALVGCLGTLLILKVAFLTCGEYWRVDLNSPSGHTGASTLVYGAIAIVVSTHARPAWRPWILVAGGLLVAAIAASRVVLHMHSRAEVAVGLTVGCISLAWFGWHYRGQARRRLNLLVLGLALGVTCVLAYGSQSRAEVAIHGWVYWLRNATGLCVPEHPSAAGPEMVRIFTGAPRNQAV